MIATATSGKSVVICGCMAACAPWWREGVARARGQLACAAGAAWSGYVATLIFTFERFIRANLGTLKISMMRHL